MQAPDCGRDLPLAAPSRGENGKAGDATTPGTLVANVEQQAYFADVATKVVLPMFKAARQAVRAGLLVARSRRHPAQPGRQPRAGWCPASTGRPRSPPSATPTTTSRALLAALEELGLAGTTDVILTADHGFSTISKESATSSRRRRPTRTCRRAAAAGLRGASTSRTPSACTLLRSRREEAPLGSRPAAEQARQRADRRRSGRAGGRRRGQRRLGPHLPAERRQGARRPDRRGAPRSRTTSAACSSTTRSAASPARCRSRRST